MADDAKAVQLRRLQELKKRVREEAALDAPLWRAADDYLDVITGFLAAIGLFLASDPIGWSFAGASAAICFYDRFVRKPRKTRRERKRQQNLDVIDHRIDKLIGEIRAAKGNGRMGSDSIPE